MIPPIVTLFQRCVLVVIEIRIFDPTAVANSHFEMIFLGMPYPKRSQAEINKFVPVHKVAQDRVIFENEEL